MSCFFVFVFLIFMFCFDWFMIMLFGWNVDVEIEFLMIGIKVFRCMGRWVDMIKCDKFKMWVVFFMFFFIKVMEFLGLRFSFLLLKYMFFLINVIVGFDFFFYVSLINLGVCEVVWLIVWINGKLCVKRLLLMIEWMFVL